MILDRFKGKFNLIGGLLGLACGFIIRDETIYPNLQQVDDLIIEYERKELLLQQQRREVLQRLKQVSRSSNQ